MEIIAGMSVFKASKDRVVSHVCYGSIGLCSVLLEGGNR